MPGLVPHECLFDEIAKTPEIVDRLRASRANNAWPDVVVQREVAQTALANTDVSPICLYEDGIPLHRRGGVIAC